MTQERGRQEVEDNPTLPNMELKPKFLRSITSLTASFVDVSPLQLDIGFLFADSEFKALLVAQQPINRVFIAINEDTKGIRGRNQRQRDRSLLASGNMLQIFRCTCSVVPTGITATNSALAGCNLHVYRA